MITNYELNASETFLLNLTETLLGNELDRQIIHCRNKGINRRLSKISFLSADHEPDDVSIVNSSVKKMSSIEKPYPDKVIFGTVGESTVAILPQKISKMLQKGWSYNTRLELLWSTFRRMSPNKEIGAITCLPNSIYDKENGSFSLSDLIGALGQNFDKVGDNLLLCNPSYYGCLIVEEGLSQEEFSHVEHFLRSGGNIILSADKVILDGQIVERGCLNSDQICLNF